MQGSEEMQSSENVMIDHRKVQRHNIASRYVLGELTTSEREEFELHYFDCGECAEEVRALMAIANAESVLSEIPGESAPAGGNQRRLRWFEALWVWIPRPAYVMAPLFALLMLNGFTTYQWTVLRRQAVGQAVASFTLHPAARGDETSIGIGTGAFFVLSVDVPGLVHDLKWQVRRVDSEVGVLEGMAPSPAPGTPLTLLFPASKFRPGGYILSIREAADVSQIPPAVTYRFRMH